MFTAADCREPARPGFSHRVQPFRVACPDNVDIEPPRDLLGHLPRRRKRKNYSLLVLAAGIFLFGAAAATLYYVLRPSPCGSRSARPAAMTRN